MRSLPSFVLDRRQRVVELAEVRDAHIESHFHDHVLSDIIERSPPGKLDIQAGFCMHYIDL